MLGKIGITALASVAFVAMTSGAAFAGDLTANDITNKLAAKKKPLTRSLTRSVTGGGSNTISAGDRNFLGNLGRGIKFSISKGATKEPDYAAKKPEYGAKKEPVYAAKPVYKEPTYDVQEIKKIEKIVTKYELPKLDFEIQFEFGSAEIKGESIIQLVELAKALNHPSLNQARIILGGHTDAVGSDSANQILSQRRSDSVADFLYRVGKIQPERLVPIGFGEHRLKNTYDPAAGENRRVEVINITSG